MKIVNFVGKSGVSFGIVQDNNKILPIPEILSSKNLKYEWQYNIMSFINGYPHSIEILKSLLSKEINFENNFIHLKDVKILPPVPTPSKIICLGLNYKDHVRETGKELPSRPILFSKAPSSIIGTGDTIILPEENGTKLGCVDYEVELAAVIGKKAKNVTAEEVKNGNYILGYTILNDVTSRSDQKRDGQFFFSKSFDTFAPMGPWIVTSDDLSNPQNLKMITELNEKIMQDSSTAEMVFNVLEIISYISQKITILPGDIISTGTPCGVGFTRNPPVYLKAGDNLLLKIENIGILKNPVK